MTETISTSAAVAMFDVARSPAIDPVHVLVLSQRNSGDSAGNTIAGRAANTDGAEVNHAAT